MHLKLLQNVMRLVLSSYNTATLVCACTLQRLVDDWAREAGISYIGCYTSVFCMFTVYNSFVTYKLVTLVAFHGFMVSATYNYIITNSGKLSRGHMLGNMWMDQRTTLHWYYHTELRVVACTSSTLYMCQSHYDHRMSWMTFLMALYKLVTPTRMLPIHGCKIIWPTSFYGR